MRSHRALLAAGLGCSFVLFSGVTPSCGAELTTLYSFGEGQDGKVPQAAVLIGADHNLYGTTVESGEQNTCGTVYRLAPDGTETKLYVFHCSDGGAPEAALISDAKGNLFGTTYSFGANRFGVVFEIAADGSFQLLHTFNGSDGANPGGSLLEDSKGDFYGTTNYGGKTGGAGNIFRMTGKGTLTELYGFTGGSDGGNSNATLITDKDGNLYGTTQRGGSTACSSSYGPGCGVVFKLSPKGKETVLHTFTGGTDGIWPQSGLAADTSGNLYGTTWEGGSDLYTYGCGTVYKLTPKGDETVLHVFGCGDDGTAPYAALLVDSKGDLYGTATHGGTSDGGTIFEITPAGRFRVLYAFTGGSDGSAPYAPLILDKRGRLIGTTLYGGDYDYGVVFQLIR